MKGESPQWTYQSNSCMTTGTKNVDTIQIVGCPTIWYVGKHRANADPGSTNQTFLAMFLATAGKLVTSTLPIFVQGFANTCIT